jgi:ABC-type sugar transport system ATPase subunit
MYKLSGGNQQKVVLAKCCVSEPDIIILVNRRAVSMLVPKRDIYLLMGGIG